MRLVTQLPPEVHSLAHFLNEKLHWHCVVSQPTDFVTSFAKCISLWTGTPACPCTLQAGQHRTNIVIHQQNVACLEWAACWATIVATRCSSQQRVLTWWWAQPLVRASIASRVSLCPAPTWPIIECMLQIRLMSWEAYWAHTYVSQYRVDAYGCKILLNNESGCLKAFCKVKNVHLPFQR